MPYADLNGTHVHFTDTGGEGQAIVFSHGLLFSGAMFEAQVAVLRDRFRCITSIIAGRAEAARPRADTTWTR